MLFHSPRLGALSISVGGYGREVIISIGFPVLMGDFLKDKNANLVWFHDIHKLLSIMTGLDVVFAYRLFVLWDGG